MYSGRLMHLFCLHLALSACFQLYNQVYKALLSQAAPAPLSVLLQRTSSCGSSIAPRAGTTQTNTYAEQVQRIRLQHCTARWYHPNKHLCRAGAEDTPSQSQRRGSAKFDGKSVT